MIIGIMLTDVGHAGQPGYVVHEGEVVILTVASNLPASSNIDYFAELANGDGDYIGIGRDDVEIIGQKIT